MVRRTILYYNSKFDHNQNNGCVEQCLKTIEIFPPKNLMARIDKVKYWIRSADQDWKVANHLFEKGDYSYALFFGHLTVEKILKAIFTDKKDKTPPFSHNLVYLSEKADLELNDENLELLEEISDFNLEARYPDDKFSFYKKSTVEFTKNKLEQIERLKKWLLQNLQSSI